MYKEKILIVSIILVSIALVGTLALVVMFFQEEMSIQAVDSKRVLITDVPVDSSMPEILPEQRLYTLGLLRGKLGSDEVAQTSSSTKVQQIILQKLNTN